MKSSLLEKHGVALCLAESDKFEVPEVITAKFVYARLRKDDYSAEDRPRSPRESGGCAPTAATCSYSSSTKTPPRERFMLRSC